MAITQTHAIVLVIMALAGLAVVLVIAYEAVAKPRARRYGRPRWIAVGLRGQPWDTPKGVASWPTSVSQRLPDAIGCDATAPDATAARTRWRDLTGTQKDMRVAVVWLGINDLLSGTALDEFEGDLAVVLRRLARSRCRIVLISMPIEVMLGRASALGMRQRRIERLGARWRESITRVGQAYRAEFVQVSMTPDAIDRVVAQPSAFTLPSGAHQSIADALVVSLQRLLREPPVDWDPDDIHEQSHDPAVRRGHGLAPLP